MAKAVFLDRDGVINRKPAEGDYVTSWDQFHILPGVAEGVSLLNRAGFSVIVVTNQRSIAKGLLTIANLEKMHERMSECLARAGAIIDGIYYCPHDYAPPCNCRKPAPGMLLEAARSRGIDLAASWMIGDSDVDMEAGKNAGCKTVRVLPTKEKLDVYGIDASRSNLVEGVASSLLDAARQVLQWEAAAADSFTRNSAAT